MPDIKSNDRHRDCKFGGYIPADSFNDIKNVAKMITQSDQYCVIIRKTSSMAVIKVPYCISFVFGSVLIGYAMINISRFMIIQPYGNLDCIDDNVGPSANIMAHDWI